MIYLFLNLDVVKEIFFAPTLPKWPGWFLKDNYKFGTYIKSKKEKCFRKTEFIFWSLEDFTKSVMAKRWNGKKYYWREKIRTKIFLNIFGTIVLFSVLLSSNCNFYLHRKSFFSNINIDLFQLKILDPACFRSAR